MIEVLEFIFQDFWHFVGSFLLLLAICPWNRVTIGGIKVADKLPDSTNVTKRNGRRE